MLQGFFQKEGRVDGGRGGGGGGAGRRSLRIFETEEVIRVNSSI